MGRPVPCPPEDKEVQLGMPGAWADDKSESSDHCTTKIGGLPDWPVSLLPHLRSELLKCAICGGSMGLVAQVHAPLVLHGARWHERTIYVFGCPASGCGVDPTCWRTIKVQKEMAESLGNDASGRENSSTVPETSDPPATENTEIESFSGWADASTGPDEACDWWEDNVWGDNPEGDSQGEIMRMQDLESSLMEAGRLAISGDESLSTAGVLRITDGQEYHDSSDGGSPRHNTPVLPCFYIYFQAESLAQQTSTPSPEEPPRSSEDLEDFRSIEHGGEIWAAEEYEPDHALHADRTYLRFKKRLDCYPEQCIRYCFDGQVLWAVDEDREPGRCAACGGPRVFEMQLMPPLLYFLQQANRDLPPQRYGPDDWDWFTLIVFTCAQSCSQKESDQVTSEETTNWSISEEATIVQQEFL